LTTKPYIDFDSFKAEAERRAGASDWGDESFLEAFGKFVASLNSEAELTDEGLARSQSHIMKTLVARLRLLDDRKRYPDIEKEVIRAPLMLTGLARSGTSFFNAVLAADQRNHAPLHWQVWVPSPPPGLANIDHTPQIEATQNYIHFEGWQDAEVRKTHDYTATNASEDTFIQDLSLRGVTFGFFWEIPSYSAWIASNDKLPAYRMQYMVMQALQYGQARDQWVVKGPPHQRTLEDLFAVFPDARLVINHRDPVKALASSRSMLRAHRAQFGNRPPEFSREHGLALLESTANMLRKVMEFRKNPKLSAQFIDVPYKDLERDAVAQAARVYDHYGIEFTPQAKRQMEDYIAENRKGKHGSHKYDISDLGVSAEEVRETFRFYTDHYDIELEA